MKTKKLRAVAWCPFHKTTIFADHCCGYDDRGKDMKPCPYFKGFDMSTPNAGAPFVLLHCDHAEDSDLGREGEKDELKPA